MVDGLVFSRCNRDLTGRAPSPKLLRRHAVRDRPGLRAMATAAEPGLEAYQALVGGQIGLGRLGGDELSAHSIAPGACGAPSHDASADFEPLELDADADYAMFKPADAAYRALVGGKIGLQSTHDTDDLSVHSLDCSSHRSSRRSSPAFLSVDSGPREEPDTDAGYEKYLPADGSVARGGSKSLGPKARLHSCTEESYSCVTPEPTTATGRGDASQGSARPGTPRPAAVTPSILVDGEGHNLALETARQAASKQLAQEARNARLTSLLRVLGSSRRESVARLAKLWKVNEIDAAELLMNVETRQTDSRSEAEACVTSRNNRRRSSSHTTLVKAKSGEEESTYARPADCIPRAPHVRPQLTG